MKSTKHGPRASSAASDQKARAIAGIILEKQEHTALWLGRKFSALAPRVQAAILVSCCLALGGSSGWVLGQALLPGSVSILPAAPLHAPDPLRQERPSEPDSLAPTDNNAP